MVDNESGQPFHLISVERKQLCLQEASKERVNLV